MQRERHGGGLAVGDAPEQHFVGGGFFKVFTEKGVQVLGRAGEGGEICRDVGAVAGWAMTQASSDFKEELVRERAERHRELWW